jgi:hypothetical protein
MVRYSENPTARVEVHVAAPPEAVWPLVSDISVPARFSSELAGAEWADGFGGAVGRSPVHRAQPP